MDEDFKISPSQGLQLMALSELVRSGDVVIRSGWDADHEKSVMALLLDVGQEIAMQVGCGD